mmetsp:Transcript_118929/g.341689  ORF Transcript_118929/g.341689 Transcript_118929/m.341689 type:complete len:209 (+) Transcript_118929:431-1057(+)
MCAALSSHMPCTAFSSTNWACACGWSAEGRRAVDESHDQSRSKTMAPAQSSRRGLGGEGAFCSAASCSAGFWRHPARQKTSPQLGQRLTSTGEPSAHVRAALATAAAEAFATTVETFAAICVLSSQTNTRLALNNCAPVACSVNHRATSCVRSQSQPRAASSRLGTAKAGCFSAAPGILFLGDGSFAPSGADVAMARRPPTPPSGPIS